MKPLITAADLERVPQNGELAITDDTLLTPLAREEAHRRGITFRIASARARETSSSAASGKSSPEKSARIVAIGADHGGLEQMVPGVTEEVGATSVRPRWRLLAAQGTTTKFARIAT